MSVRKRVTWAAAIAGVALVLGLGASAPAHADTSPVNQDVNATVTINESMSVSGFSPTVAFGATIPGAHPAVPHAQTIHIVTNHTAGTTVSIANQNGGWHTALGQPDIFGNDALTITNPAGSVQLNGQIGGHTNVLRTFPAGDNTEDETWTLSIPTNLVYSGDLNAQYTMTVTANP